MQCEVDLCLRPLTLIPLSSLKSQGQAVQLAHSYEPVKLIFFTTSTPSFVAYFVVCLRHTFAAQSTLQQNRLQRQPLNPLEYASHSTYA
jgi:hypothetical protein